MPKKIILKIDDHEYIIPDDQTKDLTGLLANLGNWNRVKKEGYSSRMFKTSGHPPVLEIAVVDQDSIIVEKPEAE